MPLTIVLGFTTFLFLVLWIIERSARHKTEVDGREALDRQEMLLARRAIARLRPEAKESSDFWPYEDVRLYVFGPDEKERHARQG